MQPLSDGEAHDPEKARDPSGIFNDTEVLDERVAAATELLERLTTGPARPPLVGVHCCKASIVYPTEICLIWSSNQSFGRFPNIYVSNTVT